MNDKTQAFLFDADELNKWKEEWAGMPEFSMKKIEPFKSITVNFTCQADVDAFEKLLNQKIKSYNTYWFPKQNIKTNSSKAFFDSNEP